MFAHANYLINLAATNPQFHANSIRALSEELVRADQLELPFLVLHPGAHLGAGEEAGLEKIVNSIDDVFRKIPKVKTKIALEITAGQGSCIGHRFEHLAHIIAERARAGAIARLPRHCAPVRRGLRHQQRTLDTKDISRVRSRHRARDRLVAIHVNDSKTHRGSRVDRHEHIGKGPDRPGCFPLHHAEPTFPQNPESTRNAEGERPRGGRDESKNAATISASRSANASF